jgi:hypothetical protein
MQRVEIQINGYEISFDQAREIARLLAEEDNDMATLVAWNDRERNIHSPQSLHCEIKGDPGWEVYGRNHEGRLRISINNDAFVFIYT